MPMYRLFPGAISKKSSQRGFILISLYLLLAVFAVYGLCVSTQSLADVRSAQKTEHNLQTLYLAEAGLDRAIVSLRDPAFSALVSDGASDPEIRYTALGAGGYQVDIDPVPGRPGIYRIQASGFFPGTQTTLPDYRRRDVDSYARVQPSGGAPPGLFGEQGVNLNGSVRVDSYNSSSGAVRSTGHGRVGTNAITASAVRINGSVVVYGDVMAGPGSASDAIRITGSSVVTGRVGSADQAYPINPVEEPAGTEDLRINGNQTVMLAGGVHHYRQLTVNGGGRLTFSGPATLVVDSLTLNGNAIATSGNIPANLTIRVAGSSRVTLNGNASFYGTIYAPRSEVVLNGSNRLFGAVTGRLLTGNGSVELWGDDALSASGGSGTGNQVQVISWTESI